MPDLQAFADLEAIAFAPLRRVALAEALEHDLTVAQDNAGGISIETSFGRVAFTRQGAGCRAEIAADRADFLQALKDSLVYEIGEAFPEAARALRWSDGAAEGALPDNARLMTVHSVEQLDCGFRRVTLAGDVSRFSDAAIHFRLGLPPAGIGNPIWPRVGANGATIWPEGERALHLPVYTARRVDPEAGHLVCDLYEHPGGRATAWAASALGGEKVLVTGPGGGGCKINGPIRGFADDTAFPAIARILEASPDLTGSIRLYPSSDASRHYPFPNQSGVTIVVMEEARTAQMAADACADLDLARDGFLWFAGERAQAAKVRQAWKCACGPAKRSYISAYWQQSRRP